MSSRIAVLGGMFDPVHNGHVEAAQFALKQLSVDCLKMIPCHIPNHKKAAAAAARHRLAMLEIAVDGLLQVEVDAIELEKNQLSYTVDTLAAYKKKYSNSSLVFILGADSFNSLPLWHRWELILELSHLFVLTRPGFSLSPETMAAVGFEQRRVSNGEELFESESGKILFCENFDFDISSSSIKQKLIDNQDVSSELDEQVIEYISDNRLYQKY
jgi:nicotinate-nucleotide adenylyltransferase